MYDYTQYVKDVRDLLRNIDPGTVGGRAQDLYFQLQHVTNVVLKQLDEDRGGGYDEEFTWIAPTISTGTGATEVYYGVDYAADAIKMSGSPFR